MRSLTYRNTPQLSDRHTHRHLQPTDLSNNKDNDDDDDAFRIFKYNTV